MLSSKVGTAMNQSTVDGGAPGALVYRYTRAPEAAGAPHQGSRSMGGQGTDAAIRAVAWSRMPALVAKLSRA